MEMTTKKAGCDRSRIPALAAIAVALGVLAVMGLWSTKGRKGSSAQPPAATESKTTASPPSADAAPKMLAPSIIDYRECGDRVKMTVEEDGSMRVEAPVSCVQYLFRPARQDPSDDGKKAVKKTAE